MKFTEAWANIARQNVNLKIALIITSFTTLIMTFASAKLSLQDPILIERSCYSTTLKHSAVNHTEDEVKTFVNEALKQRFNTKVKVSDSFIIKSERKYKIKEQSDLRKKGILQTIIINGVSVKGDKITVDSDRLFNVKNVRSAVSFPLIVKVETQSRTESNPYGLILTEVSSYKKSKKEQ